MSIFGFRAGNEPAVGAPSRWSIGVVTVVGIVLGGCAFFGGAHQKGERALGSGDYQLAVDAYTEAIAQGDNVAVAYANRCYANGALGEYHAAVSDCTQALDEAGDDIAPESFPPWEVVNNRGVAYLDLRKHEDAGADSTPGPIRPISSM